MENRLEIEWWLEDEDGNALSEVTSDVLEDIFNFIVKGYNSGEFNTNIKEVEYTVYWKRKYFTKKEGENTFISDRLEVL